jgi:tetratricopeptide (TPR) repeat protein
LRPVVDHLGVDTVHPEIPDSDAALAWFEAEWPNIVALVDTAPPAQAWRLARMAHDFRAVRSTWEDWLSIVHKGLDAAVSAGDALGEAWLLQSRCALYVRYGRADETADDAARVIAIGEELRDPRLAAVGHDALASAYFGQKRYDEALAGYEKALDLDPHPAIEAHTRNNVAQVLRALGRPEDAVGPQRQAIQLYQRVGEVGFAAFAVANLAELYADLGMIESADQYAREAIDLSVASGLTLAEAFGREVFGRVLRLRGLHPGALRQWELAAELYVQVRSPRAEQMRVLLDDLGSGV